jgi:hypothetical protein
MNSALRFAVRAIVLFVLLVSAGLFLGPLGIIELALIVALSLTGAWVLGFAASRKAGRRSQTRSA